VNSLTKVIAGTLGLSGFGVAILAGLAAGNDAGTVLTRGLVAMLACYGTGFVLGTISERTVNEYVESHRAAAAAASASAGELAGDNSNRTVEKSDGQKSAG